MFSFGKPHDLISIGDITTDAFIRIKDASVTCDIDRKNCRLCVRFGDKVPFESVTVIDAVGNSPNAAVSAARLGLKSAVVTNVGDDEDGRKDISALKERGVDTKFVRTHKGKKSNYHYVLWYEDERTILIKHEEFKYEIPNIGTPSWIYLSSLGAHSLPFHTEIANYLTAHPTTKLAFQPGTFQIKLGYEPLKNIYEHTEVFFCNVEEARRILGKEKDDVKKLLSDIRGLGVKIAVITDGPKGAYAMDATGAWFMPPYPDPKPPLERTGAGDAFASTFISALALGKTTAEALSWAPINSMSVVQDIGAQRGLLTRSKLEEYLKNAPADYRPNTL